MRQCADESVPAFTLRQSSAEDAPLFYCMVEQTMREFVTKTWGVWDEARIRQDAYEDSCSACTKIVQVADTPAGVFVVERYPTHIQLEQIYLLAEYQRMGIGTALIKGLMTEAAQLKIPVRLRVLKVNPARCFYERLGFSVVKSTSAFCLMEKVDDSVDEAETSKS